jgi:Ser/Thr protein kinase RdoA (MazF antagonist)
VRLFNYLGGRPATTLSPTPMLRRRIGEALGRLDWALADFRYAGATDHQIIWDLKHASSVEPLVEYIQNARHRHAVESVFYRFHCIAPRFDDLQEQVIHNDLNAKNVLISADSHDRIAGIIDFGDIVHSKRVFDLAVTCSRQVEINGTVESACDVIAGYSSVIGLSKLECEVLLDLMMTRLAMRIAVRAWRACAIAEFVNSSDVGDAICDTLEFLLTIDPAGASEAFERACHRYRT